MLLTVSWQHHFLTILPHCTKGESCQSQNRIFMSSLTKRKVNRSRKLWRKHLRHGGLMTVTMAKQGQSPSTCMLSPRQLPIMTKDHYFQISLVGFFSSSQGTPWWQPLWIHLGLFWHSISLRCLGIPRENWVSCRDSHSGFKQDGHLISMCCKPPPCQALL